MSIKNVVISLINFYQKFLSFDKGTLSFFAPGGACKYNPSCSEYAKEMIREVGAVRGTWLGLKRIWRCR